MVAGQDLSAHVALVTGASRGIGRRLPSRWPRPAPRSRSTIANGPRTQTLRRPPSVYGGRAIASPPMSPRRRRGC